MALNKLPRSGIADSAVTTAKVSDGVINAATEFTDCTVASTRLADCAVSNAKLSNSAITIRGSSTSLGGSLTLNPFVNWQSKITGDGSTVTTAVAGQGFFVDTSSATATIRLPSSASVGDTISIKDYAGTFGTNNLTIDRNSHKIQGQSSNSIIKTNRAAVTLVYADSTKGWLYSDEHNVGDLSPPHIQATGGTVTTSGDFKIHTFTGDGNFVVSNAGDSSGSTTVDYLVVAGGGAGGGWDNYAASGGGAGGFRTNYPQPATGGLAVSVQTYPISVGAGGTHPQNQHYRGASGSNSVFSTITSAGGGGGGGYTNIGPSDNFPNYIAADGGSGGGAAVSQQYGLTNTDIGDGNTPPVSPSQGNNGGQSEGNPIFLGGGGGGAGQVGANGPPSNGTAGSGGNGSSSSITGSAANYAGGGGGGASGDSGNVVGPGGNGGGGNGGGTSSSTVAQNGATNEGSGGGGGGNAPTPNSKGGNGGSGIVIIRYKFQN